MTSEDWKCRECGSQLVKTSEHFLACERGCGKLRYAPKLLYLPIAYRIDCRRFRIMGRFGYWKYVPHKHDGALDRAPAPGEIVAKVAMKHGFRVRTFDRAKLPRGYTRRLSTTPLEGRTKSRD